MQVVFHRGVYLPELDLWMDSRRKRDSSFISHAHSDHISRHRVPVVTPNTALLLADYLKKSDTVTLGYHEPLETPEYTLTLYPAGHCLGSAQALVQSKATGERVLYTGDFKVQSSPTNEPLEPVPCDILIMEATYGRPQYTFPPQEQVLATAFNTLRTWLSRGEKPVVQGWTLGKSQEILHHLLAEGFDVVVEEGIYRVAQTYQEAGVTFPGNLRLFNGNGGNWPDGHLLLCPPGKRGRVLFEGFRRLRIMELTGWAIDGRSHWGRRGDVTLPFSDHPDFNELVGYVRQVGAKHVYTVNGFPELAGHLRAMGYPAVHLDGSDQAQATGFQMKLL